VRRWHGAARAIAVASLGVVGVLGVVLPLVLGRAPAAGAGDASPRSSFSLAQARAFDEFRLFSAGLAVDGLPLRAVLRRDDAASYVSFVYGDCDAEDDAGCAPPAEVQVWPVCRRSLAPYDGNTVRSLAPERVVPRGVPAAFFDGGTRLELETGRSHVVVFARTRAQVLEIVAELEAVDGSIAAGSPLPRPAVGLGEGGAMGC
jgi:hypothetical protein